MFCRNCGKDIGESKFCPECGTKQTPAQGAEENEEIKKEASVNVEAPKPQNVGLDGELITEDGRRVFPTAQRALEAPVKLGGIYKARYGLGKTAIILYVIGGATAIIACVPGVPSLFSTLTVFFFMLAMAFNTPSTILNHIFVEKKSAKWLKEQNVDIRETIRSGSSSKDDKMYAERMIVMKHLNDNPKATTLYVINGVISILLHFFIATSFMLLFIKLPEVVDIIRYRSFESFNSPFWINSTIYGIVTSVILVVPTAITGTLVKKRAFESYEAEEKTQNDEQAKEGTQPTEGEQAK